MSKDITYEAFKSSIEKDFENYLQEENHFGMNKKFAQKFNSYEEAAKKANILYSDWNKHVNIIKRIANRLSSFVRKHVVKFIRITVFLFA